MIHLSIFIPLVIGGVVSALWREHRRKQQQPMLLSPAFSTPALPPFEQQATTNSINEVVVIDDTAEISHYQRISLIALALSSSGALFFAPITLASIPLLSYNTFYFLNTVRRSRTKRQTSALTIFELASLAGSLVSGRYLLLSSLLAFSFSRRKWGLQAGNLSSIGMGKAFDPRFRRIWVLRGDVEVEINISEIQADDVAVLHAGDIIRMNGEIVEGEGFVRQYALTGMMQAIPKQIGDPVFAFTQVATGNLSIKYT